MLLAIVVTAVVSVVATLGLVWFALEEIANKPSHWSGRRWEVVQKA